MKLYVGQRVSFRTELAHLYDGTVWAEKLARPRSGTIREVPLFAFQNGAGTVLIEWDSLTGGAKKDKNWVRWHHTDFLILGEPA